MIKLYENIKYYRKKNSWSQEELAKRMNYTDRSMIAKIEAGKVDLSQSKIIEFAKVFGIAPGDLMGWDDEDYTVEVETVNNDRHNRALLMYEKYLSANPEIQSAIEALLKMNQQDS